MSSRVLELLQGFPVDGERNIQLVRIGHFVLGYDPRSHRPEGREVLAQRPLRSGQLHVASAYVIEDGVAEDVVLPLCLGYIAATLADDDRQLSFIVRLLAGARQQNRLAVADKGQGILGETP